MLDFESAIELWDVTRGRMLHEIPLHWPQNARNTPVNVQLAFLDNQTFLVVEGLKRQVARFDVTTGKQRSLLPLNANTDGIVAVSPDGTTIATCTSGGRIVLYDALTAKPIDLPETHLPPVESLAFSGDGKPITTIAGDEIRRWDSDSGKPREFFALPEGGSNEKLLSRDGLRLVTNDRRWRRFACWSLVERNEVTLSSEIRGIDVHGSKAISGNGSRLACIPAMAGQRKLHLWDTRTGLRENIAAFPDDSNGRFMLQSPIFSQDGEGTAPLHPPRGSVTSLGLRHCRVGLSR